MVKDMMWRHEVERTRSPRSECLSYSAGKYQFISRPSQTCGEGFVEVFATLGPNGSHVSPDDLAKMLKEVLEIKGIRNPELIPCARGLIGLQRANLVAVVGHLKNQSTEVSTPPR